MRIVKERTRLIFYEYNDIEKRKIEDLVATMDKAFTYEDMDNHFICIPPGMEDSIRKTFPKIKIEDHSDEYWEYATITPVKHSAQPRNQLQIDFINFVLENAKKKNKVAGILGTGVGKLEPYSRKIPTPNGYKRMGDLKVGDKIFGSDGKQITVTDIYEHGEQDIYKITFNDGRIALCGEDHLWNVYLPWMKYKTITVDTKSMLKDFKKFDKFKAKTGRDPYEYKYGIPLLSGPVQYDYQPIPIDPYVVGAFIGNGCNTLPALSISSGDEFIPYKIAGRYGFTTKKCKSNYTYVFYDKDGHLVKTKEFFKDIPELIGYSRDKCIPNIYIYNSLEVRMELLRGLMDTDGSISYSEGRFNIRYSSCSIKLLEQIQELIRGLGFIANIGSPDKRSYKYINGYCNNVSIRVPQKFKQQLFSHPRKLKIAREAALRSDYHQPFRQLIIKNIELIKREKSRCIRVDADDALYLTEDFIVTHNTFMGCYSAIELGLRTLIIAPTSGIKAQWAETLTNMFNVDPSRVKVVSSPKDFINVKADFVVTSQASLAVLNKNYDLEKIMKTNKFGIKIIDEVQMWFHNIVKIEGNSNICHNWYLTGTFGRSGSEENNIYQQMFGDLAVFREKQKNPTIFNRKPGNVYGMKPHMHVKMMWGHSGLSKEEIASVSESIRYSERAGKWMRYGISIPAYTKLVIPEDGTMTKFLRMVLNVIKSAEKEVSYGRTLILSPTISSVNIIAGHVKTMFPDKKIGTINSHNPKIENDRVKAECDILISTVKSCGTGFDVKDLSKLIVVEQFKSWILTDQVSGRLRRRPDGKDTYMWDIVDGDVRQLIAWANARADVLKRKSKTFKVIDI